VGRCPLIRRGTIWGGRCLLIPGAEPVEVNAKDRERAGGAYAIRGWDENKTWGYIIKRYLPQQRMENTRRGE